MPQREDFETLRALLLQDERTAIAELQRLLAHEGRAQTIARALAAAVREAEQHHGPALIDAIRPPVVEAISISARRDHERLSEALAPVIGPAIVRAVTETLRRYTQSVEAVARTNFTIEGLKWRLEAKRTGLPFSEVVLKHTLLYRVEQLFLIHKGSGLLITHLAHPEVAVHDDKEAIAGMMSAIQSFAQDSLIADRADRLQTVDLGGHELQLVQGPHAMIAVVLRGKAPSQLFDEVRDTLEEIHRQFHHELREFQGVAGVLESTRTLLEPLLKESTRHEQKQTNAPADAKAPGSRRGWWIALAGAVSIVALVQWQQHQDAAQVAERSRQLAQQVELERLAHEREFERMRSALNNIPGLVVNSLQRIDGNWRVTGLRDPLAPVPAQIAKLVNVSEGVLQFELRPYFSLEPELLSLRARAVLEPPDTVTLRVTGTELVLSGSASAAWIKRARYEARVHLPYFTHIDMSAMNVAGRANSSEAR